jgi:histone deacetylase 1/2
MTKFHTDEYIAFLKNITPDIQDRYQPQRDRCMTPIDTLTLDNCGDDCPIWPGMYEFCAISAGYLSLGSTNARGSIGAAQKLNHGDSDIAIK